VLNLRPRRHAQRARDHVRLQPTVRVRKQDPLALRKARAGMTGVAFSEPALRQRFHPNPAHARILFVRRFRISVVRSVERSSTTMISNSTPVCARSRRIVRSIRASSSRAAMTTEQSTFLAPDHPADPAKAAIGETSASETAPPRSWRERVRSSPRK